MLETYAKAVKDLGVKTALVVRGDDGLDEISLCAQTNIYEIEDGKIKNYKISPKDFGFELAKPKDIEGQIASESVEIMKDVLSGKKSAIYDLVALNSGASLYACNKASSILEGVLTAKSILDSKKALEKLEEVINFSKKAS